MSANSLALVSRASRRDLMAGRRRRAVSEAAALGMAAGKVSVGDCEILIDERGGFLEDAEGANQLWRHNVLADGEVDERAGSLRAVVAVGGDVDLTHRVGFGAGRNGQGGLRGFRHRELLESCCPDSTSK